MLIIGILVPVAVAGDDVEKTKLTTKSSGKTLYATLTTTNGQGIKGKKIKFSVKGSNYYATTNAKGVAKIKTTYSKIGTHTFTAKFAGDKKYKAITKKGKFTIPKPTISMYAKPSCGCRYSYKYWHKKTFVNYCPKCYHYNTLRKNPKRVYEREYTCGLCDSDFCAVCGKEKMRGRNYHLQKA